MKMMSRITLLLWLIWLFMTATLLLASRAARSMSSQSAAQQTAQQPAMGTPVLVELFTSEGCSDCPPADNLVNAMAHHLLGGVNVIPLSMHVTYWNTASWHDRFSDERYTNRQKAYQQAFRMQSIFTPQIVIDGRFETVGNDKNKVFELVSRAAAESKPATVEVSCKGDSAFVVAHTSSPRPAKVLLAITEDDLTTEVSGGENRSRTLQHSAVVRWLDTVGKIKDGAFTRIVPLKLKSDWAHEKLHVVAFVQDSKGHILGATATPLDGGLSK